MVSIESQVILERFDGTNFHTWKVKREIVLLNKDFWSVVDKS
jgi:hypothetical protein